MDELPILEDDGLITPEIGSWGEEKHRLVALYASLFARAMRSKWEYLVYIDLFSGAGRSRIRGTNRIIPASPLVVLMLPDRFDHYILCEKDHDKYLALRERIGRDFPEANVHTFEGDANSKVAEILSCMPPYRKDFKVLAFCFVDPFAMSNLQFATIRELSVRYMDFLVLIPSGMEARRFMAQYERTENLTIDAFLGDPEWRLDWKTAKESRISSEHFVIRQFGKSMESLNYIDPGLELAIPIRSDEKNLLLYRLVLYSRHKLGKEFWEQAKKYSRPQRELF